LRRNFLLPDYRAAAPDVTASIVVQTVIVSGETPELLALASSPGSRIAGVVGWTDLTAPGVAARIAFLRGLPGGSALAGLRHQVQSEPDPGWLTRPDVLRGLAAVADAGLVYDLVITPGQLDAAIAAATALPRLRFVLDHLAKPAVATGEISRWADGLRRLAALPNTSAKLSGLVTEADWRQWQAGDLRPYTDVALDAFGPDRLMFGSDWPVCTLAASHADVLSAARELTAHLSPAERDAIFSGTAKRIYRLRE
jgi:L-fuconolactonase